MSRGMQSLRAERVRLIELLVDVWDQFAVEVAPGMRSDGGLSVLEEVAQLLVERGRLCPAGEDGKDWYVTLPPMQPRKPPDEVDALRRLAYAVKGAQEPDAHRDDLWSTAVRARLAEYERLFGPVRVSGVDD